MFHKSWQNIVKSCENLSGRKNSKKMMTGLLLSITGVVILFTTAHSQSITEQLIRDAILGKTEPDLTTMDLNDDGKVDVADIVQFAKVYGNVFPDDLKGYVWIIAASFSPEQGNSIPIRYPFAMSISENSVISTSIPGFNPTKGLLNQNISGPGEIPGAKRPSSYLSLVVPEGTHFSYTESGDGQTVTLTSDPVPILAHDPNDPSAYNSMNPLGAELRRSWSIQIKKASLLSGETDHGTIIEETTGFLPNSLPITSTGKIYMVPFSPVALGSIEEP